MLPTAGPSSTGVSPIGAWFGDKPPIVASIAALASLSRPLTAPRSYRTEAPPRSASARASAIRRGTYDAAIGDRGGSNNEQALAWSRRRCRRLEVRRRNHRHRARLRRAVVAPGPLPGL